MSLVIGSRLDLAYVVGKLSQYAESPTITHWTGLKRAYRYVNSTQNLGILYDGSETLPIEGYLDGDWLDA